ncbi:translocation/assembly module TamB domain-containing protein [Zoogloea sp. LCSB751]|uniref:translocation/assembly module TamB domain-containing protein n=1 Tax=Zoogloea sp. LCSB751 TaxID=1965277 RepID=UPI0009A4BE66|nr:translocation/assembly module TamB domain-containing protein [Zoogloea sp. LCSB751]
MSDAPEQPAADPAPDGAPSPAPAPRRDAPSARLLRGALAAVLGLLTVVVLLLGWLGASESGLRALAGLANGVSGGLLSLDKPQGYLLGEFKLGSLQLRTPTLQLEIRNLAVDWRPGALASRRLDVASLAASELRVASLPDDTPLSLPLSLELPIAVHLGSVRVDRLLTGKLIDGQAAPPDFELTGLDGSLESDGRHHDFSKLKATAPFGQLAASGRLDGRRPFALTAMASLNTRQAGEAYAIEAQADGTLETLALHAKAKGAGMEGAAKVLATPFAALPLRSAKLSVQGVDPSRFHAAVPAAQLDVEADLEPSAAKPADGRPLAVEDWVVGGPLTVRNHQPGPYDKGKLPLESLSARLRWAGGELAASNLVVLLPGQGRIGGRLAWQAPVKAEEKGKAEAGFGHLNADLQVSGVDARHLDGRAVATRIDGHLRADAEAAGQNFSADLRDPQLALRIKARHAAGALSVEELVATARQARLDASGKLALDGAGRFELRGRLSHFDPHAFVTRAPAADLNTRFDASGRRQPTLVGRVGFELLPSRLEGKPLLGKGELAIDGQRIANADVNLDLAGNRLSAQGRYGKPGDALALHVDAPVLAVLGRGVAGRLKADGVLRGTPAQPAGEFELLGEKLVLAGLRIERLDGRGRLAEGRDGAISVSVGLAGLQGATAAEALLSRGSLSFEGTRSANRIRVDASGLKGHSVSLALAGALSDGPRWEGRLESLLARGDYPLSLQAAAPLVLSADLIRLGPAELRGGAGGRIRLDETRWQARHLIARGSVSGVQVGFMLDPATRAVKSTGDSLQIGGQWDVDIGEQANGLVRFYREKGDLVLQGDSPVRLGLDDLQLSVSAAANRLAFGFSAHGSQLGSAAGAGTALAERTPSGELRLVPDAPLLGSAKVDIPNIAWAGPLADQNMKTEGSLKGEFSLAGTPARPETSGRIRGERLGFVMADQGLHLSGGTLAADFDKDRLRLEDFSFVSPNRVRPRESRIDVARLTRQPGTLNARGEVQLASGEGRFSFRAERLPLLQRVDQWLVLSGEGEVLTGWNYATLKGRLVADAGFVELSRTPAPSLGDDVEVIDPHHNGKSASPFHMGSDLVVNLGNALYVKALGVDTRLAGELRLQAGEGKPLHASGVITAQGGVFEGYGQKLSIERGIVTFAGPIANPSLNVVALRKGLSVEAGVGIGGTARRPVVRLVSEPNVPDPEKLGWIVLGRPPDQGSGGEMALLLPAAQALLGETGGGLPATLARNLGFDEFSFGASNDPRSRVQTSSVANGSVTGTASSASSRSAGTTVPGQVVSIGKRLSTRALLSFEQGIAGTTSIVKLTYQLTRGISVIGRAGSENAVDMLFSVSFR